MSRSIDHHLSLMSLMTIQLFVIEFDQNEGKSWYPFSVHLSHEIVSFNEQMNNNIN